MIVFSTVHVQRVSNWLSCIQLTCMYFRSIVHRLANLPLITDCNPSITTPSAFCTVVSSVSICTHTVVLLVSSAHWMSIETKNSSIVNSTNYTKTDLEQTISKILLVNLVVPWQYLFSCHDACSCSAWIRSSQLSLRSSRESSLLTVSESAGETAWSAFS